MRRINQYRCTAALSLSTLVCVQSWAQDYSFVESATFALNTSNVRIDMDGDGMPDAYESLVGLNPMIDDSESDPDKDGFSNIDEYNSGTDPLQSNSATFAEAVSGLFTVTTRTAVLDTDGDRMPDWWELKNGLNITRDDTEDDPDKDGASNLQEFNAGTNPLSNDQAVASSQISSLFTVDTAFYSFQLETDADKDGMPDWWEIKYGLNINANDALADGDSDGLSNLTEYQQGKNPTSDETITEVAAVSVSFFLNTASVPHDSDGDGIPDYWEIANGLDPHRNDAREDPDGDGRMNFEEYNSGTNPRDFDQPSFSVAKSEVFILDTGGYNASHTKDTDGDGMPDWWEIQYALNPSFADAASDPDGDGFSNIEEYDSGRNPKVYDRPGPRYAVSELFVVDTGGRSFDTDGDGLPDWWEKIYFNDPRGGLSSADADSDGFANLSEFIAGTDPLDRNSALMFAEVWALSDTGGLKFFVRWTATEGRVYSILASQRPEGPYAMIAKDITATPPMNSIGISITNRAAFFRVSVQSAR